MNERVQHEYLIELQVALKAALFAGDYFRSQIDSEWIVKMKSSPSDLVTEVDPFCENLIRETIHRYFTNDCILGEESTAPGSEAATLAIAESLAAERLWIVDPLDGTNNFVARIPLSVVSIAFACKGETQVGVIYDPYRGEVFFSARGFGAFTAKAHVIARWLSESKRIHEIANVKMMVSNCEWLNHSVVATGFPVRGCEKEWATERALLVAKQVRSFRVLGAAALHLAYVAAGRLDLFWEYELNAWDIAAGMLLVHEAGGVVRALGALNETINLQTRHIVACCTQGLAAEFAEIFLKNNIEKQE